MLFPVLTQDLAEPDIGPLPVTAGLRAENADLPIAYVVLVKVTPHQVVMCRGMLI